MIRRFQVQLNPLRRHFIGMLTLFCFLICHIDDLPVAPGGPVYAAVQEGGGMWVIPIEGNIQFGVASFVERAVREAKEASVIVVEINTFGGRVDAATEIRDALLHAGVPTVAWVKERAWSAGALIALAADEIWMSPGASIGAAEPRPADEKTISALRAEFEAMAERTGKDPLIAAAMVDQNVEVPGLSRAGEILTLSASRAVDVAYAAGIVADREQLQAALALTDRPVYVAGPNWAERLAGFFTEPIISEILLSLAFLGLIAEVTTPGFGLPGIAGLTALFLFFGGRLVVGLVGWEVLILFLVGLVLLLIEVLIIPGVGITGVLGALALGTSLVMSFGGLAAALRSLGMVLVITIVGAVLLWRVGSRRGLWRRFILTGHVAAGEQVPPDDERPTDLVGKEGLALTVLRPAGTVVIDGERIDVVSEGDYIASGARVVVKKVEGNRIVVRAVTE